MTKLESGRDKHWASWYPTVIPKFGETPVEKSVYGEPNNETLGLLAQLPRRSNIGDIGGGEARYAYPLALMGYNVFVTDVHKSSLLRAQEKGDLVGVTGGSIYPLQTDATGEFPIKDDSLDGVLNAGFGYLIPPSALDPLFGKMVKTLRRGGLLVFEFATNRDRQDTDGNSLIGDKEYNYKHDEGKRVLETLSEKYGIRDLSTNTKTIHFEEPYFLHNDLIIAHGFKK